VTTDKTPATLAVDVLAVLRRHAESHRASADSDAYSAQEAPRLEYAVTAVAKLIEAMDELVKHASGCEALLRVAETETLSNAKGALARVKGESA